MVANYLNKTEYVKTELGVFISVFVSCSFSAADKIPDRFYLKLLLFFRSRRKCSYIDATVIVIATVKVHVWLLLLLLSSHFRETVCSEIPRIYFVQYILSLDLFKQFQTLTLMTGLCILTSQKSDDNLKIMKELTGTMMN
uniref:Uncharacterized protein n=1 Tax=Glossina brevipalpis TaxID=37001 RepID=A0A1A9WAW6_9MUSC